MKKIALILAMTFALTTGVALTAAFASGLLPVGQKTLHQVSAG
jgi:hypothetical protein